MKMLKQMSIASAMLVPPLALMRLSFEVMEVLLTVVRSYRGVILLACWLNVTMEILSLSFS